MQVIVNGTPVGAPTSALADGTTTHFDIDVPVHQGDQVTFEMHFTATFGKLVVYTRANTTGHLTITNTCPDGAASIDEYGKALIGTVNGTS